MSTKKLENEIANGNFEKTLDKKKAGYQSKIDALNKQIDATSNASQKKALTTKRNNLQKEYNKLKNQYNTLLKAKEGTALQSDVQDSKNNAQDAQDKIGDYNEQIVGKFTTAQNDFITKNYENAENLKKSSLDYLKTQTETVDNLNKQITLNRELANIEKTKANSYLNEEKNTRKEAQKYGYDAKGKKVNVLDVKGNIVIPKNISPDL